ncbi:unnamed protein product [Cylicocyclus nassatus]|uniref:Glycosyltransferase family 92 protein n=1 Tax=Cylicocyclus nassatus TaxID=53992 RepID=A0AA36GS24_CYLNA|nr:unnamed protein product [Cylicocyclus nassatus]
MGCVPHYDQLLRHKQLRTGDRGWNATSLSLIAAYDYGIYSVVTTEADGWFGDKMPPNSSIAMLSITSRRIERAYALPLEYNGSETLMLYLPILVFHKSHLKNWIIFPPKCVIDPRKVLLMWVHHVVLYFPGYKGISLPASKAVVRHYRDLTHAEPARRYKFYNEWYKYGDVHYPSKLIIALYRNIYNTLNRVYGVMDYLEDFEEDLATIT